MVKSPICKCGHNILMHDGSYGRQYCQEEGCKCQKFEWNGKYTHQIKFPIIQIDPNPNIDGNLILLIDAFIHSLCELGYGSISNGTEGDCITHNIYQAFLHEPNKFIKATSPNEIIKNELKYMKGATI